MVEREYDLVLHGASGFVGRLVAAHLAGQAPADLRIALSGRSAQRVADVRATLPGRAADWPVVSTDSADAESLLRLAESARVVVSTVGPYLRHGLPLVGACAAAGTHYADLTGETLFARRCIDEHHASAVASGARIVNSCGFDSIPSDLGVLLLAEQAKADGAGELSETTLVVRSIRGGISGGTVDSLRGQLESMRTDRDLRRIVVDPYALSPDRRAEPDPGDGRDPMGIARDPELGWTAPFVMAPYNTRIVRRSNALQNWAYGRDFRYREVVGFGRGLAAPVGATALTAGLGAFMAGMSFGPTRAALDRLLPSPGTGPSDKVRASGRFRVEISTRTTSGARYVATVAAKGDPGYAATALMFGQSALALAVDLESAPQTAGLLTPATGLGSALVQRLRAAGMTLTVAAAPSLTSG
ncbi:MAG: saccharopine dehydrogenase NADP-binding domain-containing protein [bacterium]